MNNKGITPFIRNNYFKGKQLTVRDFQDEQDYHISKLTELLLPRLLFLISRISNIIQLTNKTFS